MPNPKQKVTVVISAFNEEKTIKKVIESVRPFCDELLVVIAKKSSDKTKDIVRSIGAKYFIDQGLGKGNGMRLAISKINGGIIVFIDADGSHIPKDIPKLVDPILQDKVEMVIASRFLGGSEELYGDFNKSLRMIYAICIAQIINWRFHSFMMDTQNGFRAIDAKAAKKLDLKSNHTEIETEMVMKCLKNKYNILEVPSMEIKRRFGESNIRLRRHGWGYLWTVAKNLF